MKATSIYERNDKLYIHSLSKTTAGFWVINAPIVTASKENFDEIGRSIRECLAASREGVPNPISFTSLFEPVLTLSGVKSFATFVKQAKCVEIEMINDGAVTLIPTRNGGAEDGFTPLPNRTKIAVGSDDDLGSAAVAALAMTE